MKLFLSSIAVVVALSASAQVFPEPLEDPTFIYHPASKAMLLLGGSTLIQDSAQADVWKWDGQWTKINASGPGSRVFFKGGVDKKTGDITMFAGAALGRSQQLMSDLWSFDGRAWKQLPVNDIGSHDHFKMVYADYLKAFVYYGGNKGRNFDTATYILQNGKFTEMNIPGPGAKYHSGMVYDKSRKKIVLYGGGVKPDEHWEFDGKSWQKRTFDVSPGNRLYHAMVYDENLKAVIIQGGTVNQRPLDPENLKTPATWLFDGTSWKKIAEENIFPIAMGYHPVRKSVMAFAHDKGDPGQERSIQLWELKDMKWTRLADYGTFNAVTFLEKHLAQKPQDLAAHYAYANALRFANRTQEAETVFRRLAEANVPQKQNVFRVLINLLMTNKNYADAAMYLAKFEPIADARTLSFMNYNIACGFALASQPDKAFPLLFKAAHYGYNKKSDYEADTDLTSLRGDMRWKELSEKLK